MFRIADGREHFYQWDINRQIAVEDTAIKELHFCNRTDDCSLVVEVVDGVANVPNVLLQNDWDVRVYGYTDEYTKIEKRFKVITRTKPSDYVYTETELKNYDALGEVVEAQGERLTQVEENTYDAYLLADDTAYNLNQAQTMVGTPLAGYREINFTQDGYGIGDVVPFNHTMSIRKKTGYYNKNYISDFVLNQQEFKNQTINGVTLSPSVKKDGNNKIVEFKLYGICHSNTTFTIMPRGSYPIEIGCDTLFGSIYNKHLTEYISGAYLLIYDDNGREIKLDINNTVVEDVDRIYEIKLVIPAGTYNNKYIDVELTNEAINIINDNTGELIGVYPLYLPFYEFDSGGSDWFYFEPVNSIPEDEAYQICISYNRKNNALIQEVMDDGFILVWDNQAYKVYAEPIEDYEW